MLQKTSGIILSTTTYSESSLILKVYTRDFGLQSYIASGVRGKKSKNKINLLQALSIIELVVVAHPKSNLHRVSEVNALHPYTDIPYNFVKSSIALFLNEMLYKSLKEDHPDEALFDFVIQSFQILDLSTENVSNFHLYFLIQLSKFLGFYPQGVYDDKNCYFDLQEGKYVNMAPIHPYYLEKERAMLLGKFIQSSYTNIHEISISKLDRKLLLDALVQFYKLHIQSFGDLKSLEVLEQVLA